MSKNIHLISTDKGQMITKTDKGTFLWGSVAAKDYVEIRKGYLGFHLYITNNEETNKETKPCWCLDTKDNSINYYQGALPLYNYIGYKKIILTTDHNLIKDGVQAIPDEFLEWFVKNPSCEEIKFEKWNNIEQNGKLSYEIPLKNLIIPKKSKQETLEETTQRLYPYVDEKHLRRTFKHGAKWQTEKIFEFIQNEDNHTEGELGNSCIDIQTLKNYLNQFKNTL